MARWPTGATARSRWPTVGPARSNWTPWRRRPARASTPSFSRPTCPSTKRPTTAAPTTCPASPSLDISGPWVLHRRGFPTNRVCTEVSYAT
ncbi:MAG: hypothetical protein AMJ38_02645 [Dehalococcoidia bacterium DG_22]|nr:MAG: hypothetical protein AMJ38_02645 [Dehalococcoidia bacterium DG_22]